MTDRWKTALWNSSLINLRLGQNCSHLENRNHRQEANKQKQQREKETNRADEHRPIPLGRLIKTPGRGQKISMQTGDYDHEALKPHADAGDPEGQPQNQELRTDFL